MKQMCSLIGSVIFVRHFESLAVKKIRFCKPIFCFRLHLVHQSEVVRHVKLRAIRGGSHLQQHCSFNQDRLLHLGKFHHATLL